ncbi:uncharacterized protein NFIA_032750 [Aspergillus fischeri NRRL 181]|uniref:Actin-like ATPase domain-containing protein n=1 Tax=Neosartorya fischeri (strain ATCC 1020 / DSM 3700 / CBS 544.65 / FGSC A1164 / JCM 1740 / NRRL 181 / WB 181) TaxID=331117 RepID=A1CY90_NEOFI|nr:uncharacterized protein NFIA_032750 [Aspergillus fischeri NRRL 181]EAW23710.1 hypothetical protein NFIA_032750 [Aspergillus fischeri NRRL 181]
MAGGPRIVVGIDFGTTYSGVAWALQSSPEEVEVIKSWPGARNSESDVSKSSSQELTLPGTTPKVPTTISYENGKFFWGYQTPMFGEIIRGVKLLLDSTQEIDYTPAVQSKDLLTKYDKKPLDIARDCLQLLVDSAKETLRRRFGKALDGMEITYVLTVPAVWTDKAKNMTLTAATDAGISALDVILVSEPEAAALSCLNASQLDTLKDGDVVIICDAGGGTVDLISYCVKSVEPLELMEVTQGTGMAICGSVLLDKRFENYLAGLLGEKTYQRLSHKTRETAMNYWQDFPNFAGALIEDDDGYSEVAYSVPLNGVSDKREIGLEGGFLTMSKENVGGIFLPVVDDIENLVQEQMLQVSMAGMQTKAILLVGGFGSSEYLFRRLQSAVINVTVMQPPNAWSAVVRGAVFRGLGGNQVGQRIARCHYGVTFEEEYNPRVHNARDKYWDAMTEMSYVADRMKWYIEKGKPISEDEPIRMSRHQDISEASCMKQLKKVSQSLYICNLDKAPDHLTEGVFKVCTLEADLSAIPPYLFHSCTNSSGQKYYEVAFEIAMTPTSASILFDLEFNGVSYGSVQAKY